MSSSVELEDYRWLLSDAARGYLQSAADADGPALVTLAKSLRRDLTAARTHLVLEQVKLRRRGAEKFSAAERMFFTPQGLEQSTDEQIAAYKASRYAPDEHVADLCCGIGGDLVSLAMRGRATGVDLDPVNTLLAEANCAALGAAGAKLMTADVTTFDLAECGAWHIDPDRRPANRRVSRVDLMTPDAAAIDALLGVCNNGAVKLAAASAAPPHWSAAAEIEWIGSRGSCRQQVAWFGALARAPGRRAATIVDAHQSVSEAPSSLEPSPSGRGQGERRTVFGFPDEPINTALHLHRYIYDPHAVVLAAHLVGSLAAEHQLELVSASSRYLTADHLVDDPALAAFAVREVLPFDVKRVSALLRERNIGRLEIKKRGVELDANDVRQRLRLTGDNAGVLLLARIEGQVQAILAQRR